MENKNDFNNNNINNNQNNMDDFDICVDTYNISNSEICELTITIYELFEEYILNNLIRIFSSKFYDEMINNVAEIIYADLYDDDDEYLYDELFIFIEQVADIFLDWFSIPRRTTTTTFYIDYTEEHLLQINDNIKRLKQLPQPAQRTPEWYEFRYNLITASNLHKVFGSEANVNSLIYEKCKPLSYSNSFSNINVNSSLHWGVKYEPVSLMVYEDKYKTRVGEFGCIQHPQYSFIGASPDGINIDPTNNRYGRMLEIKNIVNRDITGIPKDEYWIQTQIQMETCNINECDFVETRFKEYENEQLFYEDMTREYKGIMLRFYENININNTQTLSPIYKYMPLNIHIKTEHDAWINEQISEMQSQNFNLQTIIYWYLDEISCVLILRNTEWFKTAVYKIETIWNTILNERENGYNHRIPNKKNNMVEMDKSTKSICLIRLDENGNII